MTRRAGICASSKVAGTVKSGSGLAGNGIGTIPSATFSTCTSPAGVKFTVRARDLPWRLNLSSYDSATGVTRGTISHVQVALYGACTAVVNGTSGTSSDGVVTGTCTKARAR